MRQTDERLIDLLNDEQRRSLAVMLRLLEEGLREVDSWVEGRREDGILYSRCLELSPSDKATAREAIAAGWAKIAELAGELQLKQKQHNVAALMSALMSERWADLCGERSAKLIRCGPVHEHLARHLDPHIDTLIELTRKLGDTVRTGGAGFGQQPIAAEEVPD